MRLVITPHRPWRKAMIIVGATLAAALAVAIALDYGHWRAIAGAMVSTGEKRSLLEEAASLREANAQLRFEVARLRRTEEINRTAREENHELLVDAQAEIAAMRREVQFYRDAIGSVEVGAGPRVGGIQVKPLDGVGRYGYKLVMTHVDKDDKVAEGSLRVALRGDYQGRGKALGLAELVESGPEEFSFKFKHFYLFEGTIRMPEGFVPRQIEVAVRGRGRGAEARAETYDWASVLN
ncbi:MAG: hypothetical protein RKL32_14635 [Gammaproteobacteria bacterium]